MVDQSKAEIASFASWKFDLLDALGCDKDVTDAQFRVAFRLLQHVNSRTGLAWPSYDRLAVQIGRTGDPIRAAINGLVKLGWLEKNRPNRHHPNQYRFVTLRANSVIDARLVREEALKEKRNERSQVQSDHVNLHGQNTTDHVNLHAPDHVNLHTPDHVNLHGKHLKKNYLNITPSNTGSEGDGYPPRASNSYSLAKTGEDLPLQFDTQEQLEWAYREITRDRPLHPNAMAEVRRLLGSGKATRQDVHDYLERAA
jgi:hypothetical protein